MHVHITGAAFVALVNDAVEQRPAVVAERGRSVRVHHELVFGARVVRVHALVHAGTLEGHELVTPLVHHI